MPDHLSPNTRENYEWAVRKHLAPTVGNARLAKLTPQQVIDLLRAKAEAGLSKSSQMRIRSVLVLALRQAEVEGLVARNVAALTSTPRVVTEPGRSLTLDQAQALLAAANGEPLEIALLLGLLLGLRPGETLGLLWENVDLDAGVVHVRLSLKLEPSGMRLGEPKTPKSKRSIAVPALLVAALRAHRIRQTETRLAAGARWHGYDLAVTTSVGTPVHPSNYRRAFARMTRRAGIGNWHPNELRHSFVSLLHDSGVPLETIADLVGHDGTRMTSGVYRHLVDPVVRTAVEPIDRLFGTTKNA